MIKMLQMRRLFSFILVCSTFSGCNYFKPFDKKLVTADDGVRAKAIEKLAHLPLEKQSPLVPVLLDYLNDPDSRVVNRAVEALVVVGPATVESLKHTLKNPDVFVRVSAASTLERLGSLAQAAVPDLINCLKDPHPLMREQAAYALGKIAQTADQAGPPLLEAFNDPNQEVKDAASDALKNLGITPPAKRFS